MVTLGIILTLVFALIVAWGALTETMACDAYYNEPKALAKANAQAYAQALASVKAIEGKVKRGASVAKHFAAYYRAHNVLSDLVNMHKSALSGLSKRTTFIDNRVNSVEPRFAALARARKTARAIGIRLRPVNQALRKAYMREVNRRGLDFEAARELDLMLA